MAKILIVDDEPRIRELIREHLEHEGFQCEEATDGSAALAALAASGADLVILDIMMPFVDGMTCLREMRKRKIDTPVIMLTARGEEYDKLAGLEGGADDYVVKPFSPRELVARVKVVLARTMPKTQEGGESFVFGDLVIDTASHSVKIAGELPLRPRNSIFWCSLYPIRAWRFPGKRFCKRCGTTTITARTAPWIPMSKCCAATWANTATTS